MMLVKMAYNRMIYAINILKKVIDEHEAEINVDLNDAILDVADVTEFIARYVMRVKRKELTKAMSKHFIDGKINAYVFNNMILNYDALATSKLYNLRTFLVSHGIDYEVVTNAFGWGETMIVLYNMKKLISAVRILPTDEISVYNLPTKFS